MKLPQFVERQKQTSRPIVCVTSGGTQVPLEKNTVRFIENFSKGERGALSVEYFLSRGYSVVVLRRTESKAPFTKVFSKLLSDRVGHHLLSHVCETSTSEIGLSVPSEHRQLLLQESDCCKFLSTSGNYLEIEFVTVDEYLSHLEQIAKQLAPFGPRVCFYLAAAVSDFFIPEENLTQHKIQSSTGLTLELTQVPKRLGALRNEWAPHAFIVSFKLETDSNILIEKALRSIDNYGLHLVIANLLHTRREECILVSKHNSEPQQVKVTCGDATHLEEPLVRAIEKAHFQHMMHEYAAMDASHDESMRTRLLTEMESLWAQAYHSNLAQRVRSYTHAADAAWSSLAPSHRHMDHSLSKMHNDVKRGTLGRPFLLSALIMGAAYFIFKDASLGASFSLDV